MAKSMFKTLLLVGVSLLVFGPTRVVSHLVAAKSATVDWVRGKLPDQHLVRVVETDIGRLDETIDKSRSAADRLGGQLSTNQERIDLLTKEVANHKVILTKASELLGKKDLVAFRIAGRDYGRDDVAADCEVRLAHIERMKGELTAKRQLADLQRRAIGDCQTAIRDLEMKRGQLAAKVESLKLRLASARSRQEINAFLIETRDLIKDSGVAGTTLAELEDRVRSAERSAGAPVGREKSAGGLIQWSETDSSDDLRARVLAAVKDDKAEGVASK